MRGGRATRVGVVVPPASTFSPSVRPRLSEQPAKATTARNPTTSSRVLPAIVSSVFVTSSGATTARHTQDRGCAGVGGGHHGLVAPPRRAAVTVPMVRVTMIAVQSVDGFITNGDEPGAAGFASRADQRRFRQLLAATDCSVFGAGTYRAERDLLRRGLTPARRRVVLSRRPETFAADVVAGELEFTAESPRDLLDRLAAEGLQHCSLLGGAQVYGVFLAAGLVDELCLSIEPWLFGSGARLADLAGPVALRLAGVEQIGPDTLFVRYQRRD